MNAANLAKLFPIVLLFMAGHHLKGQISHLALGGANLNQIITAVPFLTIAPDARASGMGDAGVASSADVNSQHWNPAKYPFTESRAGISLSYSPWLTNLIPGIHLAYFSGYYKINKKSALSSSFRYFSLGEITFTSIAGVHTGTYRPAEFALDAGYSRLFTEHFSGGVVFRYIHSDLTKGQNTATGEPANAATSIAGDLGLYYQDNFQLGEQEARWALGMNLSNLGTSIAYSADADGLPIPSNMRLGGRFELGLKEHHSVSLLLDLNKLLVPTPPVYDQDTATGDLIVVRGKAPPRSMIKGMFQSFGDAPGVAKSYRDYSVFQEEMHEIMYALGIEYQFKDFIALRSGYHHEHATKGNRSYFTFGLGVMTSHYSLELSYLLPRNGQNSPLANTFRFTLTYSFGHLLMES